MLRVLFDKNVPYPLRRHLNDCRVSTAEEEGWAQISNGELITRAEGKGYEILVTCDQNVRYQQNLGQRRIALVVLGSNIWHAVKPKIGEIAAALSRVSRGSFEFIEVPPPPKRRRLPVS